MTADVAAVLDEIDVLLGDGRYDWAASTLKSIAASVARHGHVTSGQRLAVGNISAGVRDELLPSERFRASRRYEGFESWRHR